MSVKTSDTYIATVNACKLCTPMGACLAFRGIEGAMPLLHGSQGCSTYMRRYIISHFNEPMDIASSSLGEKSAIYGGAANLKKGIINVITKYHPRLLGIATTCLTETIGDNVPMILREFQQEYRKEYQTDQGENTLPLIAVVSTPSYSGSHMDGFHNAVKAVVMALTEAEGIPSGGMVIKEGTTHGDMALRRETTHGGISAERSTTSRDMVKGVSITNVINLLPGLVSPADVRYLKEVMEDFGCEYTLLPDISESLDAQILEKYPAIPTGGTPLSKIRDMYRALATIEFGRTLNNNTAGVYLQEHFGIQRHPLGLPIGIGETDRFFDLLEHLSGSPILMKHQLERGRLIDAYVDSHKYLFGKRAIVYGEEDLVVGLTAFLSETGVIPALCASGGKSGKFKQSIQAVTKELSYTPLVEEGADFRRIAERAKSLEPDFLIGHSKGYRLARELEVPLIRVGFPIHDRIGGQRILHLGYRGAQQLLDRVVNAIIEKKQNDSRVGYTYM